MNLVILNLFQDDEQWRLVILKQVQDDAGFKFPWAPA
jgi:hypothetical protein